LPFGIYDVTVNMPNCAPIREEVYLGAYTEPLVLQVQRKKAAETLFGALQQRGFERFKDPQTNS